MQVHVGTVEKRVAFRENRDGFAVFEMLFDLVNRFLVEAKDQFPVLLGILMDFRCHRINQRQFYPRLAKMRPDDAARVAVAAALGEIGDHIGFFQRAHGLQRQQFRVARTRADADQPACFCVHIQRPGLARALTAAAVMALPPMRPRTMA